MDCDYRKLMDKLLAGNLDDAKLIELKEHAQGCKDCSDKLMQIEVVDKIIENDLLNVPYVSNKDSIMFKITTSEFKLRTLSILYRSRKYICAAAAILAIIVSIHFIKPFIYTKNTVAQNNKATPSTIDNSTSSNAITENNNNTSAPVDVRKLQFILPSDWSAKVSQFNDNTVNFYENDVYRGTLIVGHNYAYKGAWITQDIYPNGETLWTEDISIPLGKGKMTACKITSPAAEPVQTVEFEIGATIPISDDQQYEILIKTKDADDSSKKLFMSILNNIKYCNNAANNTDKNASAPTDVHKLKFTLPSNWDAKINPYDGVGFYENNIDNGGGLVINYYAYRSDEQLIGNITPNHSELLWSEIISTPLGNGKMAAFKITPGVADHVSSIKYEVSAIIPISDIQAYEIWIYTKDASDSSKKLFMDILNNIKY